MLYTIFINFKNYLYHKQKKHYQYLLLTVNISSNELVFLNLLNRSSSRSSSRLKGFTLWCLLVGFSRKKRKLAEITTHCHSLSLVVIRCLWLLLVVPLVVPLVVILCHSLSFVVTLCTIRCLSLPLHAIRCHSLYHSLSLVATCCHRCQSMYYSSVFL